MDEHRAECGRRLRALLLALGLRPAQGAAAMGISRGRLSNWLTGAVYPDPHTLAAFAARRRLPLFDWVFLGETRGLPQAVAAAVSFSGSSQALNSR